MELNSVKETGVLIVGAGPTGLALGVDLARRGVPALVVERSDRLFPGSRGKGLQPRSLEVLDDLGVVGSVLASGGPYPQGRVWQDGRPVHEWEMFERVPATSGAPYGATWMVPQWRTQEILHARLRELGGSVRFGAGLTGLTQDADGVTAELADGTTVRAAYLVASDGGRSAVRRALGIAMHGETVDPAPMLVADVTLTGLDREHTHVWRGPDGTGAVAFPMGGTDRDFQFVATYPAGAERPDTSPDGVRKTVEQRTHLSADDVLEVMWSSDFRPRAALAERFREGRVLLAGDAAHIHSPAGGQGLNTGIQDAYNLGWKLGQVLRHGAAAELLDSYEQERLPVAADVLGMSTHLHRSTISRGRPMNQRGAEVHQLGLGYRDGPLTAETREGLAEDALRAGDRAPDAPLSGDGRLFDVLRGPHFTVLAVGTEPPAALPGFARAHRAGAGSAVHRGYGEGLFVVRPDGYVGLATRDPERVTAWLARFAG
ncbi:FAD-dependent monooxygenase [Streptomyces sp. PA03-1a]|nr:FAD-dependent monooxygenase [Streptomyces sp. PA03-1a]MDX2814997.1 FAD-dependent monooxygenase [Streptomyces sp. PA03-5A]